MDQLFAPQGPFGSLQSRREPGSATILQREKGAQEPPTEAAAAAIGAARTSQRGFGQTETIAGPEEEPQ